MDEIANDSVGGLPLAVTSCPLCGTGMAFCRDFSVTVTTLGVSGLLYSSDLLLYDRESESLWSQVMGQAVTGHRKGERLITVPIEHTTWADWKNQHLKTEVPSRDTGFSRGYGRSPYGDYDENGDIFLPLSFHSSLYHPKERVIGVEFDGEFKAYPFAELSQLTFTLRDTFPGQKKLPLNSILKAGTELTVIPKEKFYPG